VKENSREKEGGAFAKARIEKFRGQPSGPLSPGKPWGGTVPRQVNWACKIRKNSIRLTGEKRLATIMKTKQRSKGKKGMWKRIKEVVPSVR